MEHYVAYKGLVGVSLAAMNREYLPIFMQHANDLTVTRGVLLRPPVTLEAQMEWYEGIAKRSETDQVFAVLLHELSAGTPSYRYVGHTGLHQIRWTNCSATTGSLLIDPTAHGSGHGTEAKLLLLYHAFFVKGLRKISSEVKVFNGNSWGHLLKCGYKPIGRRSRHHFHEGSYVDEIIFEVFREDFEPIWEAYTQTKKLPKLTEEQRSGIANQ